MLAYAKQNFAAKQEPAFDPTEGMSTFEKVAAGFGKSIYDTGRGIGQLFGAVSQEDVDRARELDAPLMNTKAGLGGNIAGQAAQIAVPIPAGAAIKATSWAGRGAPLVGAAARGGAFGASQGVGTGESRLGNAAETAAWGAGGQAVASGAGALARGMKGSITAPVRESLDVLGRAGVPVHASQVVPSKFVKNAASALSYAPLSGAGKAAAKQQEGFNRAVGRTFGADAPALSDDVMKSAKDAISQEYERVFSTKAVKLDDQAISQMAQLESSLVKRLPRDQAAVVKANIDDLMANSDNGVIPGRVYQALRGELGGEGAAGKALKELRGILDNAAFRSVGAKDAAALKAANAKWANMRTAEKSLQQSQGGAAGNIRPASLYPLVRKGSTQEMRQLAKAGQNVLKDPIPDSGTAGRMAVYAGLGGLGGGMSMSGNDNISTLGKALLLGTTAGRVANSPMLAGYLANGGGRGLKGLARAARPAPYLLPASANASEED